MNGLKDARTSTPDPVAEEDVALPEKSTGNAVMGVLGGIGRALKSLPRNSELLARRVVADVRLHPVRAVRILGAVVLVVAIVTGFFWYQAGQYERTARARDQALAVVKDSVVQLLSYNFRTIDRQVSDTEGMLTGKFKDDYAALVENTVAQAAKDEQVAIQTAIVNESVVSSNPDRVVLLVFINQQSEGKANPSPILTGSRLRVTLDHQAGNWLISELTPV
jgi:Mce-associated membrane protein